MHPFLLFLLAIATPLLLCSALLLPAYAGIAGAVYIVYMPESGPHPLTPEKLADIFSILETYRRLFDYWWQNMGSLSLGHYALPIAGLPLAACMVSLWLTFRLGRALFNKFSMSANIN